jgi:hypothetical protein
MKHWSKCTPYAVARALVEQHDCDWDRALEFAWEAMRMTQPMPSKAQSLYRMELVQYVPDVPERVLIMFRLNFMNRRGIKPGPDALTANF